tara:strand:- start:279 stop:407 length:129 start_codon:yes stop_codon:yes gene_type:complete
MAKEPVSYSEMLGHRLKIKEKSSFDYIPKWFKELKRRKTYEI